VRQQQWAGHPATASRVRWLNVEISGAVPAIRIAPQKSAFKGAAYPLKGNRPAGANVTRQGENVSIGPE
jgi:hypothetical protein